MTKSRFLTVVSVFVTILIIHFTFISDSSKAQTRLPTDNWYKKLLEKNVSYENDACEQDDKDLVREFFKNHQPQEKFPICHNDCPIVKCRPVIPFPSIAKTLNVGGVVSVHVLVDEKGKTIYARILGGHQLMRETVKKAACETQFRQYERKHQGVMHFLINSYEEINIPNKANVVSQ